MATTRYFGKEVEVRLGTATGKFNAAKLDNVDSIEWTKDPNVDQTPAGLGSSLMVNMQRIAKFSGSLSRWYNADVDVCCGDTAHEGTCGDEGTFAAVVGAYETGVLTPLYIEVTNTLTGDVVELQRCIGKYSQPISSPEGYIMEKWDFNAEDIDYTPP
jgi:hypothetical protein